MIYIEPTPYVLALVRSIQASTPAPIEVLFVAKDVSQPWGLSLEGMPAEMLPSGFAAACRAVEGKLDPSRYGIVHLAGWGHPVLLVAMLLARLRGIPVAMETDTALNPGQPWFKRALKRSGYPLLLRVPDVFLPGGTRQKRYLRHYGVSEDRIMVAQMTVDVAAIAQAVLGSSRGGRLARRMAAGIADDACVFLFVGRLEPRKGLPGLLAAFAKVSAQNDKARLIIVGDGPSRGVVESAVASSRRIVWRGRLTGPALIAAYADADAFVLPAVFEPWGLVVNEAMAAGLPVIATRNVGCVDDLVIHARTGLIVERNDAHELAEAMNRLLEDKALRRAMSAAARARIATWTLADEARIVVDAWRGVART